MKLAPKQIGMSIGVSAIAALSFLAGRAGAGGIPSSKALNYTGMLQDATGAALAGPTRNIEVKLWSHGSDDMEPLCSTGSHSVPLAAGRFSVSLPDKCTQAVRETSDAWVEVLVDGASLGRTKLGAVPYAVETEHAVKADTAASAMSAATADGAAGSLQTTLQNLQDRVSTIESAYLRTADGKAVAKADLSPGAAESWDGCVSNGVALACDNLVSRACHDMGYQTGIWDQEWASAGGATWWIHCIR